MSPDRTPCIVGVGNTPFGAFYRDPDPKRSENDLALDAIAILQYFSRFYHFSDVLLVLMCLYRLMPAEKKGKAFLIIP